MIDQIYLGDALAVLKTLPDDSLDCCVTSPPYWGLRDYCVEGQLGAEKTPGEYVERMVAVFREVRRVLKPTGTLWLNLGDTIHKKQLQGIPWRVAFALQDDGWYLRSEIIWHKPNAMPESVKDRPTKAHEQVFMLAKSDRYFYDADAVREPWADERQGWSGATRSKYEACADRNDGGIVSKAKTSGRNRRSVWSIATKPFKGAHFAVMPAALVEPCVLAGSPVGGVILDPFFGSGTVGMVANQQGRHYIGIELNIEYINIARERLSLELLPSWLLPLKEPL